MCGRYALDLGGGELASLLGCHVGTAGAFKARWNIAPTVPVPIMVASAGEAPRLEMVRWGVVPRWRTDDRPGRPLINARGETVFEKPAFRSAAKTGRCIVPARCFYEWRRSKARRDPFAIGPRDGSLMRLAGICDRSGDAPGFAVITTTANSSIAAIHDRMPVVLDDAGVAAWLEHHDEDIDGRTYLGRLLHPASADLLMVRPIGDRVNDVRHEGPELLNPPTEEEGLFGATGCPDDPDP